MLADDDEFHKVFASAGGYSIEIDGCADRQYDASGLGRIHYRGAPAEIALSMPFAKEPKYILDREENKQGRSICAFWVSDGVRKYLSEESLGCMVSNVVTANGNARFSVTYDTCEGAVREKYIISKEGISISCTSDFGDMSYCVPVLASNGKDEPTAEINGGKCCIELDGWVYEISWPSRLESVFSGHLIYNRNGVYRELEIMNDSKELSVQFKIQRSTK